jgi:DNA-binding transcriptional LysR family regulator
VRVGRDFADRDLDAEILLYDPHFIVAGTSSPWARRRKIALRELAGEPWIFPPNSVMRELIEELFRAQSLEVPAERVSAASILLRSQLLATGRFLTVLPHSVLRDNAASWSLKALPVEIGIEPWPIAALTLKNRTVGPEVELFRDHLRKVAGGMSARGR